MQTTMLSHQFPFPTLLVLALFSTGCGRITSNTAPANAPAGPAARESLETSNGADMSTVADESTLIAEQRLATSVPTVTKSAQTPNESIQATDTASKASITVESQLDHARRVVETEGIIAKAIYEIAQGPPSEREADFLRNIDSNEQIYQLLAADIANDRTNLANKGIIMPWEIRTRDFTRNLALGPSAFQRHASSGSLGLSQQIGSEQLKSVRQLIQESKASLLNSRIRRAWKAMPPKQQALCQKYQTEFATEASGQNDAELARLTSDIQSAPTPASLFARGKLHAARGQLQSAYVDLSNSIASQPENEDEVRMLRAQVAAELGDKNAAIRDYKVLAENQGMLSDRAYVGWGELIIDSATADAMTLAEQALKLNPNLAPAHALLATIYAKYNQKQITVESLQTAAKLAPKDPIYFYRLGNVHAALNEEEPAIQAYTQAIAANASWWRPHAGRATAHYRNKDIKAALNDFQAAIEWAPREPSIYENRAVVLEDIGRIDEAKRDQAAAKKLAAGSSL